MPWCYARDDSPRDKTLENNTIFKFTIQSVRARVRQSPWLSIQIFPSFCHGTKFFFFSPPTRRAAREWMDFTTTGKWHREYAVLYSENQEIPSLSSTQIAWRRRRTFETTPGDGIPRLLVSTVRVFFCVAGEKNRDKKKLFRQIFLVPLQSTSDLRRESAEKCFLICSQSIQQRRVSARRENSIQQSISPSE